MLPTNYSFTNQVCMCMCVNKDLSQITYNNWYTTNPNQSTRWRVAQYRTQYQFIFRWSVIVLVKERNCVTRCVTGRQPDVWDSSHGSGYTSMIRMCRRDPDASLTVRRKCQRTMWYLVWRGLKPFRWLSQPTRQQTNKLVFCNCSKVGTKITFLYILHEVKKELSKHNY